MGIWLHIHIITTTDIPPELWELAEILPDASVQTMPLSFGWGCGTFQTAPHVHVIQYLVFEHLLRLWIGIWLHALTVTTTDASPDLWELAEILPDSGVQNMSLHFGWGWKTFHTTSHIHYIPDEVFECLLRFRMAIWLHSHHDNHRHFPIFVRVGWKPTWWKCATHATTVWLRL